MLATKVFNYLGYNGKLPSGYVLLNAPDDKRNRYLAQLARDKLPLLKWFLDFTQRLSEVIGIPLKVSSWIRWSASHKTGLAIDLALRPTQSGYAAYKHYDPLLNLRLQPFQKLQDNATTDPKLLEMVRTFDFKKYGYPKFSGKPGYLYIFIETHHFHIMMMPFNKSKHGRTGRIQVYRFFMPSSSRGWKNDKVDFSHAYTHFKRSGPLRPADFDHIRFEKIGGAI